MKSQGQKRKRDRYNETNESNDITSSSLRASPSSNDVERQHERSAAAENSSVALVGRQLDSDDVKRPGNTNQSLFEIDTTSGNTSAVQNNSSQDDSSLFHRLQIVAGSLPGPPFISVGNAYDSALAQNEQQGALPFNIGSSTTMNNNGDMYDPHRMFPEHTNAQEHAIHPNLAYQQVSLQQQQPQSYFGGPNSYPVSSLGYHQQIHPSTRGMAVPFNQPSLYHDNSNPAAFNTRSPASFQHALHTRQDRTEPCGFPPQIQQGSGSINFNPQIDSITQQRRMLDDDNNQRKMSAAASASFRSGDVASASLRIGGDAAASAALINDDYSLRIPQQNQPQLQQQLSRGPIEMRQQQILDSMRQRHYLGIAASTAAVTTTASSSVPPPTPGILLARPTEDATELSEYQCMIRLHLEVFACTKEDTISHKTQGRRRQLVVGQIAVRCRHCCCVPYSARGSGSAYFPSSLKNLYQAAQNMASTHLHHRCKCIPPEDRQQLIDAQQRTYSKGSKEYWIECCADMGIVEATTSSIKSNDNDTPPSSSVVNSYLKFER